MRQKQVKIYSFGRDCISDGIITSQNIDEQIITLSDSFLMFALECYKNEKFTNGQIVAELIKVLLPSSVNSNGKRNEKICINKYVLSSRLSLGTSSVYVAGDTPNIIVLCLHLGLRKT